jgi:hypothetical protein
MYYYYEKIQQSDILEKVFSSKLCLESDSSCIDRVEQLAMGSSNVDLSYDGSAKTMKLTALWPYGSHNIHIPSSQVRRIEVGIMTAAVPPNMEAHDIGVTGVLIVLGESKDPSPTMFSFPARHRTSRDKFSTRFLEPTGLHPTLQLSLSGSHPPAMDGDCTAYAYLTLPRTVFADRYQLEDGLFMASKNLTALRHTSLPVDLEAPAYTTKPWGSNMLLELAPPAAGEASQEWTAEVPLHLRYLEPSATGERSIDVPYPAVFWACSVQPSGPFSQSPFDRRKLGYDGLFPPTTVFWHLEPRSSAGGNSLTNSVTVPVMREEGAGLVGIGTTGVILLGFVWVLWKLVGVFQRAGYGRVSVGAEKKRN